MKNDDLQELKPVYIHEASYSANNEISLVDLALVLVRRKYMIAAIIVITIAVGVTVALLKPRIYTVNTTVEIGSQLLNNTATPFESPQSTLAKLQYSFIPQTLNKHRTSNPGDIAVYEIMASTPTDSTLIVLEMNGIKDQNDLMGTLLLNTANEIIQDHNRFYENIKQNIIKFREHAESELARFNSEKGAKTDKIQLLQDGIANYNLQQANLRKTKVISPPRISLEPTGGNRKPIVIIAAFIGIFLSVFAAFFAEFIAKVKEASYKSQS